MAGAHVTCELRRQAVDRPAHGGAVTVARGAARSAAGAQDEHDEHHRVRREPRHATSWEWEELRGELGCRRLGRQGGQDAREAPA